MSFELPKLKIGLHKLLGIFLLLSEKSYGRYKLSEILGLSKSRIRSIFEILTTLGFTETAGKSSGRKGTSLTSKGLTLIDKLERYTLNISQYYSVKDEAIANNKSAVLFVIKTSKIPDNGIFERDTAVRAGANGAITLIRKLNNWYFPKSDFIFEDLIVNKELTEVESKLKLEEYDMLIISFASEFSNAYLGALSIISYHVDQGIEELFSEIIDH